MFVSATPSVLQSLETLDRTGGSLSQISASKLSCDNGAKSLLRAMAKGKFAKIKAA